MIDGVQLYLVRHGAAEDQAPGGDRARALTARGREEVTALATRLARRERLDQIWTSPLLRAEQTARILAAAFGLDGQARIVDALAPGGDLNALLRLLADESEQARVALVGHEPDMGALCFALCGAGRPFSKGEIVRVNFPGHAAPGQGRLAWRAAPGDPHA